MAVDTPQQRAQKAQRYAPRFNDELQARMKEIGLIKFQHVADAADIRVQTLHALRNGQNYPSTSTAWGIDGALRWQRNPSSTLAIFEGGAPVALPDESAEESQEDPFEARIRALTSLSEEKKDAIIAKMRADRDAELERAEALDKLAQAEGPKPANGNKGQGRRSA